MIRIAWYGSLKHRQGSYAYRIEGSTERVSWYGRAKCMSHPHSTTSYTAESHVALAASIAMNTIQLTHQLPRDSEFTSYTDNKALQMKIVQIKHGAMPNPLEPEHNILNIIHHNIQGLQTKNNWQWVKSHQKKMDSPEALLNHRVDLEATIARESVDTPFAPPHPMMIPLSASTLMDMVLSPIYNRLYTKQELIMSIYPTYVHGRNGTRPHSKVCIGTHWN